MYVKIGTTFSISHNGLNGGRVGATISLYALIRFSEPYPYLYDIRMRIQIKVYLVTYIHIYNIKLIER